MMTGYLLIFLASFFLGTFGIGMKYNQSLAWENFWAVHVVTGMLLMPVVWALLVIPHLWSVICFTPHIVIFKCLLFGFIWGIGGMLFGMGVKYVGVSLTYGIVMGVCGVLGSIIPMLQLPGQVIKQGLLYIITGNLLMLAGVAMCALAGIRRERTLKLVNSSNANFTKGLIIVIISGILSSFINIGFANAGPVINQAMQAGALTRNASLAAWVVVLAGACLFNIPYVIIAMYRNKTFGLFFISGTGKAYKWAIISAVLFFGYAGIYGQGTVLIGKTGPTIGWPILLGLSLIFSNVWAIKSGEWKGAQKHLGWLAGGVAMLITASLVLTYANSLMNK